MPDALCRATLARRAFFLNAEGFLGAGALVLLTDDARLPDPRAAMDVLPMGSLVILRARDAVRRGTLVRKALALAKARKLLLLVADDPALALASGVQGLHLPEARAKEAAHWRARHPAWLITIAAHSLRTLSNNPHADAILLSPVFATKSHAGAPALTAAKARLMARGAITPVFALGGVTAQNAGLLAGFSGLAAIGALIPD